MNKVTLIAAGVLVIVIALFLFLSSFFIRRNQQSNSALTPVPTRQFQSSGGNQQSYPDVEIDNHFAYSQDETDKLDVFKKRLPYSSSNLEIEYSESLGLYFIQKKGPDADKELEEIFRVNGLEQLLKDRPALFIITNDSPKNEIANFQNHISNLQQQINNMTGSTSADSQSGKQPLKDEERQFIDTLKTLGDFKLKTSDSGTSGQRSTSGKGSEKSSPSGKGGGGNCATGGYPFADRNQRLIGRPYQGTHTLGNWQSDNAVDLGVPLGTPVCAISEGTIGRVKMNDPNPSSRYAGISVYLQLYGTRWWYTHLSNVAPGIGPGAPVKSGQIIGYSGAANGVPHLHIAVSGGNPVALLGL